MPNNEAPLSVTMRPHAGYDAPLFTIRGDTPTELQERLAAVEHGGIMDSIGRVQTSFAAKHNLGAQLGGQTVGDPANQAPPAQPAPAWDNPNTQQQSQNPQYAQPQYQQPPAPAYASPAAAPQAAMPGAPMVCGMPAKMVTGTSAKGPWRAWADPRAANQTQHITEKTDDPNDPRLAMGQAKFWSFVR